MRGSPPTSSSLYASQRNASVPRSAPADGSMTCGRIAARFLVRLLIVEVAQILAAHLHVLAQIEVRAVRDAFELAAAERKVVLDVGAARGVVRELAGVVLAQVQVRLLHAEVEIPAITALAPVLIPLRGLARAAEELDLHLLELAAAEREVARVDLVAKRLADLADAERHAHARRVADVLEVHEDALRRLGPQIRDARVVLERADVGLEHQVERARRRQRARCRCARREHLGAQRFVVSAPGTATGRASLPGLLFCSARCVCDAARRAPPARTCRPRRATRTARRRSARACRRRRRTRARTPRADPRDSARASRDHRPSGR